MILYEYPFQESVRTMLRLEQLFDRLGQMMVRDSAVDHHFALVTLFEIMDVASRADLKSDLLKELERHKQHLLSLRGNSQVAQEALDEVINRIEQSFGALNQLPGKAGHALTHNEWLMSVRSRISIPGGTCEFDLPGYYAWQHRDAGSRRSDLTQWVSTMMPLAQALQVLLQLLRDSGVRQKVLASGGQYQQGLAPGKTYQLLRLRMDPAADLVPEISGHRLMVSIRLMRAEADGRLRPSHEDAAFELALCA
ncbi:MAG: cell division protein ZapD [Burkholderiaceae bacterium]|nr:cell division protein ZapD [Burkholderiaceae bacterium]